MVERVSMDMKKKPTLAQLKKRPSLWCDGHLESIYIFNTDITNEFLDLTDYEWKKGEIKDLILCKWFLENNYMIFVGWI